MARYGGLSVLDLKRLKKLDAENAKLKKMYAELAIENEAIKAVLN
jgi:putative transposase